MNIKEALNDGTLSLEDEIDYTDMTEEEYKQEIERLNNKIKEAREYIQDRYNGEVLTHTFDKCNVGELLKILDKGE